MHVLADPVLVDGLSMDYHRACYPERWTVVRRAWGAFLGSLLILPVLFLGLWLLGTEFSRYHSGLCIGWIVRSFILALDPPKVRNTFTLDRLTLRQRIAVWF